MRSTNRLTYANVASTLALVVALTGGGAAVAAGLAKNSVGSKQIKAGAVRTADLGARAVDSSKVKDGSLTGVDLQDGGLDGADVRNDGLSGADIDESTLVAPFVVSGVGDNDGPLGPDPVAIAAVTLDAPAAGFVLVTGEATFSAATNSGWLTVYLRADGEPARSTYWEAGDSDGNWDQPAMMSVVVPVAKGQHTYELAVSQPDVANQGSYFRPQVTAQWFPSGSAAEQPPTLTPGGGDL